MDMDIQIFLLLSTNHPIIVDVVIVIQITSSSTMTFSEMLLPKDIYLFTIPLMLSILGFSSILLIFSKDVPSTVFHS